MGNGIPESMTAIEITEHGEPEVLKQCSRPVPGPEKGEVLIKIEAAGINRPDIGQRRGFYPAPPGAVDIPGLEVAGKIIALGEDVTEWKIGDDVCALVTGGGYAQYVAVPPPQCLPIPKGLSMVEAAAIPEAFFTVWTNVFDRGRLKEGESFLVHGGSSGIGTTAIQLASQFGARVFATAGNSEKCRACESLGAERAINYKEDDFVEVFKDLTNGRGVDVILDMVAGSYVPRDIELAAVEGRIILISVIGGDSSEIALLPLIFKRIILTGSALRAQPVVNKGAIAKSLRERVWPLIESGKVKPVIHKVFPLAEVADAHRLMESSQHIGKIMIEV